MDNVMQVLQDDTPEALSARCGVPYCMILRANGLSHYDMRPGLLFLRPKPSFCVGRGPCPHLPSEEAGEGVVLAAGETIYQAAARAGSTLRLLMLENDIERPADARPGQRLRVPEKPEVTRMHTVRSEESLRDIAAAYHADERELAYINRLPTGTPIYPGQRLLIPA